MRKQSKTASKMEKYEYLAFIFGLAFLIDLILAANPLYQISSYAQSETKVQAIDTQLVDEEGCPIIIKSARAELEIDPFQAPVAVRAFLEYRNDSDKPIEAVKFRFRLQDAEGTNKGTYQASDTQLVSPGQSALQKMRREGIRPKVARMLIRTLQIRFCDQSTWQSTHLPPDEQPPGESTEKTKE